MKIIHLLGVFIAGSISIGLCGMNVSYEQALVNGNVAVKGYLLSIENNPVMWGELSGMVRDIRTADYSQFDEDLYANLQIYIDKIVSIVRQQGGASLQRNLRLMVDHIKATIREIYGQMKVGKAEGTIRGAGRHNIFTKK